MAIVIRCECGKEFETRDENAGRRGRCPVCQREVVVPQPKPLGEADFAPLHQVAPPSMSGKAIASFVLGLCSLVCSIFTGIPAILLGIFGLLDINNPQKNVTGKGFAIAGIVMGSVVSLLIVPAVLIALLLPAVQAAREAARRAMCTNNLKQLGLALHNYESAYGSFPPAATYDARGNPLLSWRVLILPYMEQNVIYTKFHLDEPWDSPNNKPLSDMTISAYQCPSEPTPMGVLTTYQVIVDPRSMFTGTPAGVPLDDVPDGGGNTLLVVEAAHAVPWSKPEDLAFAALDDPTAGTGSKHPGGFNALMTDGSVQFIKRSAGNPLNPTLLKGLATRNGGESVTIP